MRDPWVPAQPGMGISTTSWEEDEEGASPYLSHSHLPGSLKQVSEGLSLSSVWLVQKRE